MDRVETVHTGTAADRPLLARGEPLTGERVDYFDDGAVRAVETYVAGYRHGPLRRWHPGGRLAAEGTVRRRVTVGEWREWFPDGALARYERFDDEGNLVERRVWNPDGDIVEEFPAPPAAIAGATAE